MVFLGSKRLITFLYPLKRTLIVVSSYFSKLSSFFSKIKFQNRIEVITPQKNRIIA